MSVIQGTPLLRAVQAVNVSPSMQDYSRSVMEEKRSSCPACGELEECNLEIPYALLSQSIQNGCKLCDILRQGVSGFIDGELDTIDSLILSVDITLLVTVTGKTLKNPPVVEFYTLPGQLTPLRPHEDEGLSYRAPQVHHRHGPRSDRADTSRQTRLVMSAWLSRASGYRVVSRRMAIASDLASRCCQPESSR